MSNVISVLSDDGIRTIFREELSTFKPVIVSPPDKFIDKPECAELLGGVCQSTVDNLRRRGTLKSYKIGSAVRFKRSEVIEAIENINKNGRK